MVPDASNGIIIVVRLYCVLHVSDGNFPVESWGIMFYFYVVSITSAFQKCLSSMELDGSDLEAIKTFC